MGARTRARVRGRHLRKEPQRDHSQPHPEPAGTLFLLSRERAAPPTTALGLSSLMMPVVSCLAPSKRGGRGWRGGTAGCTRRSSSESRLGHRPISLRGHCLNRGALSSAPSLGLERKQTSKWALASAEEGRECWGPNVSWVRKVRGEGSQVLEEEG